MNIPVLLITWRRADTLRQLLDTLRPLEPTRLFVACDGPNPARVGEVEKVAATRNLIDQEIDWPCQINKLYSDFNQGCRQGPISAISWFFDYVDEGIILEDDCIPDRSFFEYCEWALNAYRSDKRVMHINGNNFSAPSSWFSDEVSFVPLPQVWGWATWSDRWLLFEGNPFYLHRKVRPANWHISAIAKISKLFHLEALKKGLDAWDYQWQMTVLDNSGLAVCPRSNLISNVGVGIDATHTFNDNARTFLHTEEFTIPKQLPPLVINARLSSFFEKKMGLTFKPQLFVWLCGIAALKFRHFVKYLIILLVFGKYTPVIVASTGRSGSTMLANSIGESFVHAKYFLLPPFLKRQLIKLSLSYFDRLKDIGAFRRAPVIKTHDLYRSKLRKNLKYVFVYGDPLDSAVSAFVQGKLHGSAWLDQHIFHLCGNGSGDKILVDDVLNYEHQLVSWQNAPAFFVHYSQIWERKEELSKYLGFPLCLPTQKSRTTKELPPNVCINNVLFDRLRDLESRFELIISNS